MCASLNQDGFYKEAQGSVGLTYCGEAPFSLFDLQGAFLRMCSQASLLDFKNEDCVVFHLSSGAGPSLLSAVTELLSTGNELQLLTLGPLSCLSLTARIQIRPWSGN